MATLLRLKAAILPSPVASSTVSGVAPHPRSALLGTSHLLIPSRATTSVALSRTTFVAGRAVGPTTTLLAGPRSLLSGSVPNLQRKGICRASSAASGNLSLGGNVAAGATASTVFEPATEVRDAGLSPQSAPNLGGFEFPVIKEAKRVVLVRHGESTWNATGRIQGSSDFSVLTAKGESQAETSRQMLAADSFDVCFHSPLQRSARTAEVIWAARTAPMIPLHDLREIDLYSFQGLLKEEGKTRFGENYRMWQKDAANFEIDGHYPEEGKARFGENYRMWQKDAANFEIDRHYPVRELWARAAACWQEILRSEGRSVLVVAHNAVNQALVATATGLGPEYFRLLLQSNCGVSVLDFVPHYKPHAPTHTPDETVPPYKAHDYSHAHSDAGGAMPVDAASAAAEAGADGEEYLLPYVCLNRLNQTPAPPVMAGGVSGGRKAKARVILVCHGDTNSSAQRRFPQSPFEQLSMLGVVQARKTAELLLDVRVDKVFCSPLPRAVRTAEAVVEVQEAAECLGADCVPRFVDVVNVEELRDLEYGTWQGAMMAEVSAHERWEDQIKSSPPPNGESLPSLWGRAEKAWTVIRRHLAEVERATSASAGADVAAAGPGSPPIERSETVIVVGHETVFQAMLASCLKLPHDALGSFRLDPGSITVVDFPDGVGEPKDSNESDNKGNSAAEIAAGVVGQGVVRCINYTAHLGRWAVPVTLPTANDEDF
ncbi:unnamed protein product [Closterium sp. Yama58-4]|nr:unnamed protein product [Closterium sp. Yama58-4]